MTNKEYAKKILAGELDEIDKEKLVEIIAEAKSLYYNLLEEGEESYLTDAEFDQLERIYVGITGDAVPVGSDVRGGKILLPYPMGSLDQNHEGVTEKWIQDLNLKDEWLVLGDKQDGTSGLSRYLDKELRIAYSRGNGIEGADITRHIRKISNVPQTLNTDITSEIAVRYEVIVPYKTFDEYKKKCEQEGLRVYKNPRNYVAGKMNASEGDKWFYSHGKIIATSLINSTMNKSDEYEFLESCGFEVTPWIKVKGKDLNDEFLSKYLNERREKSPTEIDGIVIDIDSSRIREEISKRENSLNPSYSRKYKIADVDNNAQTKVVKVHWRASKTGYLKPRVEIEPVELAGVTVTYATGFNAKFIVDNGIGPGTTIEITRAGDVIPHILKAIHKGEPELPDVDYYWNDTEVDIILEDIDSNREVIVNRLSNIFGMLNVPFLRKASIEKLVDEGYDTAAKIIKMSESKLQSIIGDSAGSKIYKGIKDKLNPVQLHVLAGASHTLGRGISIRKMELIAEKLGEKAILDPKLTVNKIMTVEDFADKTAIKLKRSLPAFYKFLEEIDGYYTLEDMPKKATSGDLLGVKVCFTGVRDKDLENVIKSKGGEIVGSIKKDDKTYLVCKDPTKSSNKMTTARACLLADHIITLEAARKLWQ